MMAIEKFGMFKNGELIAVDVSLLNFEKLANAASKRVVGCYEVRPVCWNSELRKYVVVPSSISI